jgi:hypothetical protein
MTIKQFKQLLPTYQDTLKITKDIIISGYVVSTDLYGNFYKELVIEDSTGGIDIMMDQSYIYTNYPIGQKVVVFCKGLYLGRVNNVVKLGSTYLDNGVVRFGRIQGQAVIDKHIVKTCQNTPQQPLKIQIKNINDDYLYRYVELSPVQFSPADTGKLWASPYSDPPQAANHTLVDNNGYEIIVRTSGYATFAGERVPSGSGVLRGILGKYNDTYQIYINSTNDVLMNNPRFLMPYEFSKNFDDGSIYSGGWTVKTYAGAGWTIGTYQDKIFAKVSNYTANGPVATETWYISPQLDFSNVTGSLILTFQTASYDATPTISVKISTDYNGDPHTATWQTLNATYSSGHYSWTSSGNIDISQYKGKKVYIAFVYQAPNTDDNTWELDDILVKEYR